MGSWGTGIFSDDLAADVRGDWRDAIIDGEDPAGLTVRLTARYQPDQGDPDDAAVFLLALAAAQQETGRLDPAVRDRALALIDSGGDSGRWRAQSQTLARQREAVLARLAGKLRAPQPAPKRLRRTAPQGASFDVGDAVRLRSAERLTNVFAIVVAHKESRGGAADPVVELVAWERKRPPTPSDLAVAPCVGTDIGASAASQGRRCRSRMFVVTTPRKSDRFGPSCGEIFARGVPRSPAGDPSNGAALGGEVLTSWTTWPGLTVIIGWESFRREVELTRRRAASS